MRAERDFTSFETVAHDLKGPDARARTEVDRLLAIGEPSLKNLSHVLRHRKLWPEGFEWNFSCCETCAMGLASELWEQIGFPNSCSMSGHFDIPVWRSGRIFGGDQLKDTYGVGYFEEVTPVMVADKIDEYLAGVK